MTWLGGLTKMGNFGIIAAIKDPRLQVSIRKRGFCCAGGIEIEKKQISDAAGFERSGCG